MAKFPIKEIEMNDRANMVKIFEKHFLKSKKFLAFLLLLALLSAFVICFLKWRFDFGWPAASVMIAIIFTMGFVTLAFNGKQAALDQYTRGIALTGKMPGAVVKGVQQAIQPPPKDAKPYSDEESDEL